MPNTQSQHNTNENNSVRIDKWLWAARFFKTRSLASDAVKTGKVMVNETRVKASKELSIGDFLTIRQGVLRKTVEVLRLSTHRGPAPVAATLYRETPDSVEKREQMKEILKAQPGIRHNGHGRPTKRERRQIISFTSKREY